MAIEIEPKAKIRALPWQNIILYFCLFLILASAVSYFILGNLQKKTSQAIEEKEKAMEMTPSEKALEDELILYERKIRDFNDLLSAHRLTSNIFTLLERVTHPKVWFSNFSFNSETNSISVSGMAEDFIALGQQLLILKKEKLFKNIDLSGVALSKEEGVEFSLLLTFDPQIFK